MEQATIYKEDFMNLALWKQVIKDLGLPEDTDEITVKCMCFTTTSQRAETQKKNRKEV